MGDRPFYKELVEEVLVEDLTAEGKESRKQLIASIDVKEQKPKKKVEEDYRPYLLDSMRLLSGTSSDIEGSLNKLDENSKLLEEQRLNVESVLKKLLARLFKKQEPRQYEIEFIDETSSINRSERIDFDKYIASGFKTANKLGAYQGRLNAMQGSLETSMEDTLYATLEASVKEVQRIARFLTPLATYFQSEISRDLRGKLKGIKIETNAIRNSILKANQRRHEYISRKEERKQLKKLGVDGEAG